MDNLICYRYKCGRHTYHRLYALKGTRPGYIKKWISYNLFENEETLIRERYELIDLPSKEYIEDHIMGSKTVFVIDTTLHKSRLEKGEVHYFTRYNYRKIFLVFDNGTDIDVYAKDEKNIFYPKEDPLNPEISGFSSLVFSYKNYHTIFIGKSLYNNKTLYNGKYGSSWDGNTILVCTEPGKYVFIGSSIITFTTVSPIVKYSSAIGNNDISYPYAIDEKGSFYLFNECVMIKSIPKEELNYMDPYDWYYLKFYLPGNFYLGDKEIKGRYIPFPEQYFENLEKEKQILYCDGIEMGLDEFKKTCEAHGKRYGFEPFVDMRVIIER